MYKVEKSKAKKINQLHQLATISARKTIEHCIDAGELLNEVKTSLKHGQFNNWCKDNLQLSRTTVFRYMKLFKNKDVIAIAETPTDALKQLDKCSTLKHLEDVFVWQNDVDKYSIYGILDGYIYPFHIDCVGEGAHTQHYKRALNTNDVIINEMLNAPYNPLVPFNQVKTINEYKFDKTKDCQLLEYFKVYKEEIQNTRLGKRFDDMRMSKTVIELIVLKLDFLLKYSPELIYKNN